MGRRSESSSGCRISVSVMEKKKEISFNAQIDFVTDFSVRDNKERGDLDQYSCETAANCPTAQMILRFKHNLQ